ncbi:hypothetical protein N657DRAFT_269306 [Parathielavia appendiculata]|uniref:Uncharacterized protein n=1 Tax=Parathielavia appendiculata TaxID=2587402 RepID=A0AAN6Z622_9PEZI|nr:hypothetical protein N657DRAFT_269306 [Parathielavia appendiculata]
MTRNNNHNRNRMTSPRRAGNNNRFGFSGRGNRPGQRGRNNRMNSRQIPSLRTRWTRPPSSSGGMLPTSQVVPFLNFRNHKPGARFRQYQHTSINPFYTVAPPRSFSVFPPSPAPNRPTTSRVWHETRRKSPWIRAAAHLAAHRTPRTHEDETCQPPIVCSRGIQSQQETEKGRKVPE